MKICMMTNTYLPHVGGVARSVSTFAEEFLREGHEVLVVAPEFDGRKLPAKAEAMVERIPSLRNFNGSDFSVRLPLATALSDRLDAFQAGYGAAPQELGGARHFHRGSTDAVAADQLGATAHATGSNQLE